MTGEDTALLIKITEDLIALESEAPPGHERAVGEYICRFLEETGLEPVREYCREDRFNVITSLGEGRSQGDTLLYCGHMDVVPAGDPAGWKSGPYDPKIREGRLYGRGACDMKGSLACCLFAVRKLAEKQREYPGKLILLFDVDEEYQNAGLKEYFRRYEAGSEEKPDFILVGEPTELNVALGHRGVMAFKVVIEGKSAHAARPEEGINAVYAAGEIITKIRGLQGQLAENRALAGRPKENFGADPEDILLPSAIQVTMVQGGTKVNMIPDRCTLQIDCRLGKEDSPEQMEDRVRSILRKIGERSGCQISHEILTSCPAGWCERTLFRVRQMQKTAEKYGSNYGKLSIFPASCEAGILSEKCKVPAVILGPGSITQAHTANEYISLEQLKAGARIYMELFENFLKGGEKNV